ncbi:putative tetrahydroberberine oxidase [Rosa chinensis]|uniref:Putative tetrahydroberberine oxidase n=1 Tax=Rosa chinensis TaxID=74649 RepID=A0A2P6Q6J4_ROSCH|nr:putative tetrahydroberberine oxidase [Rosa chinensis]
MEKINMTIFVKSEAVITPLHESHVQAAIICSKQQGIQVKLGATLGEVYYKIAEKGQFLGSGNPWEKICFGGSSFGVILAWKLTLVPVPPSVTVFQIEKTIEERATRLLSKWQVIAYKLHGDLFLHLLIGVADKAGTTGGKTISISFDALFLGPVEKLLPLMQDNFPYLSLNCSDCTEMRWIESVMHHAGFSRSEPLEVLLNWAQPSRYFFKAKSNCDLFEF